MLYCKHGVCEMVPIDLFYSVLFHTVTHEWQNCSHIMCVHFWPAQHPQHFVYCTAKARGQPWTQNEMTSFHKWVLDAICWHCQTEQKLNIYMVSECSAIEACWRPCEKQLGTCTAALHVSIYCMGWENRGQVLLPPCMQTVEQMRLT